MNGAFALFMRTGQPVFYLLARERQEQKDAGETGSKGCCAEGS